MSWPEPYEELTRLLAKLHDESLTSEEKARLEEMLLEDRTARRIYFQYIDLQLELSHTFVPPIDDKSMPLVSPITETPKSITSLQHANGVPSVSRSPDSVSKGRRGWLLALSLVVLVGLGYLAWSLWFPSLEPKPVFAKLSKTSGIVIVRRGEAGEQLIDKTTSIEPGDRIELSGKLGGATLQFPDGTVVYLDSPARITVTDQKGKRVRIARGKLTADVARQPSGKPMIFQTPTAEVKVLGTRIVLVVEPRKSEVRVREGKVRITRPSDGATVEVATGQKVFVEEQKELVLQKIEGPPDSWEKDFEDGAIDGWRGTFTKQGLPKGSKGAIRAVFSKIGDSENYLVSSPPSQTEGLVAIHDNSHLRFTYRLDKSEPVRVILMTGRPGDRQFIPSLYQFDALPVGKDRWRTVVIPLSKFKKGVKNRFVGPPPSTEEVIQLVQFLSDKIDPGLVIDDVAIENDGPGEFLVRPILE